MSADNLSPSKDSDMILFLLHIYMLVRAGCPDARRYFWTLTFDEDTYTRARKIIYYVCVIAPTSGEFDSMNLPDFGMFIIVPEFWHVSYVLLKHFTHGPKLEKGKDEDDNKRFLYRNFTKPLLTCMRNRGTIEVGQLAESLRDMGREVADNDKVINVNKEKMGAEYRDCHLLLTYFRIAFDTYKSKYVGEYNDALKSVTDNLDVRAIFNLFGSRLPAVLDFAEHTHHTNVTVLEYILARMCIILDVEGRTGQDVCVMSVCCILLSVICDKGVSIHACQVIGVA